VCVRALIGVTAFAVASVAPVPFVQAADIVLAPDAGQETRTLNLGDDHDKATVKVRFVSPEKLPTTPEAELADAQTAEGTKLKATITTKVELVQANRTVLVTVTVEPEGAAEPGSYAAPLLLRAPGVADARSTITTKLAPKPIWGAPFWGTLLLLAGAVLGVIARWIANEASALKALQDRLRVLEESTAPYQPLPVEFRSKLGQLRAQLAREDATAAKAMLDDLETKIQDAIDVAETSRTLDRLIVDQATAIAAMPNLGASGALLAQVTAREREFIADIGRGPFATDAERTARAERIGDAQLFSAFLADYAQEDRRDALAAALAAFARGDFNGAETAWRDATDQEPPARTARQPTPVPPVTHETPTGLRAWVIRHAPELAQALTALALVIVGLFTLFDADETFRTDAFEDGLTLFAWGLGSALAGLGAADLTGKLTAGRAAPT